MADVELTDDELSVMRHALGLRRPHPELHRNHYVCAPWSDDDRVWQRLVDLGLARCAGARVEWMGGGMFYKLTPEGKRLALESFDEQEKVHEE